ncbi:MAG: M20/M25/M40 family metallo-hydrolase [Nannocystaceae bacterium]
MDPRRPSFAASVSLLLVSCLSLGCRRTQGPATPPAAAPTPTASADAEPPAAVVIDGARMHGLLAALADDAMAGRFTLAPEIETAATLLGQRYADAGLRPVGKDFRVGYPVTTGAALQRPLSIAVTHRGRALAIDPTAVVARNFGPGGKASGELVFVGYGVRSNPREDGSVRYDDLAGIDVKGRVAVLMLEGPGRAELDELLPPLRTIVEDAAARIAPLVAAGKRAEVAAEHARARKQLLAILGPRLRTAAAKAVVRTPAADPAAPIDLMALLQQVREREEADGMAFDLRELRLARKLERLQQAGAIGAIVVKAPATFVDAAAREADALPELTSSRVRDPLPLPVVQLRWHAAERLLAPMGIALTKVQRGIDRDRRPRSRVLAGSHTELDVALQPITRDVPNVVAYLPGGDLAHEIVLVGAHFDHIGAAPGGQCRPLTHSDGRQDAICNGADDNGSGTAAIVEIAHAITQAGVKPRRTLVFASFSGEEIGLFGSDALADAPPKAAPFDRGRVVAMINLDMIGRLGAKGLAIGGLSSSPAWAPLLTELGTRGMAITYDRAVTTRSDHASFYGKKIPVLFFFTGVHADYHAPGDELAGIEPEGMRRVAQLAADIVVELGNGLPVAFAEPANAAEGLVGALPGDNPATLVTLGASAAAPSTP